MRRKKESNGVLAWVMLQFPIKQAGGGVGGGDIEIFFFRETECRTQNEGPGDDHDLPVRKQ